MSYHGYNVCFLDILGFKNMICQDNGLELIKDKYIKLTEKVNSINERYEYIELHGHFKESPYWYINETNNEPDLFIFSKVNLLYGSDSIIIWADRTWADFEKLEDKSTVFFATQWMKHPKICDYFIDICNEIICYALELELPLRGALSMGDGFFNFDKHIFIGKPIVEAVELEKEQNIIGASFCNSFEKQIIPNRYTIEYNECLKKNSKKNLDNYTKGNLLDWPRHWRDTRKTNPKLIIEKLDFNGHDDKKNNTLKFIDKSYKYKDMYVSFEETSILYVYKYFYDRSCEFPLRLIKK